MLMKSIILFLTLVLLLLAPGCIKSEQTPYKTHAPPVTSAPMMQFFDLKNSTELKQFFEVKCSLCHPLTYPTTARKNYDDWLMTAYAMKNHHGALITEEEVIIIGGYLNETYGK
jgi:hypothetical protein